MSPVLPKYRKPTKRPASAWPLLQRLLAVASWLLVCLCASGQNNPYKISDSLYPIYVEAFHSRVSQKGLTLADKLYAEAERQGDKKAMCLALTVKLQYFYWNDSEGTHFDKSVKTLMDLALKTGYKQYYYFGFTNKVSFLLNQGNSYKAYACARGFFDDMQKKHDSYGLFYALDCLGIIHVARKEITLAIKSYNEALEIGRKYVKDQDLGTVYRKLAECYGQQFDYQHMHDVARTGYSVARTGNMRMRLLRHMMFAQLKLQNYEKVEEYYRIFEKSCGGHVDIDKKEFSIPEMVIIHSIASKDFDTADRLIDSMLYKARLPNVIPLKRLLIERFRRSGNLDLMARARDDYYYRRINMMDSVDFNALLGFDAQLFNQRLEIENRQLSIEHQRESNERQRAAINNTNLELANTQLSLSNSDLELQRTNANARLLRLANYKNQLEASRLRSQMEENEARRKTFHLYVGLAIGVVVVLLLGGLLILRLYRRINHRLRDSYTQLAANYRELRDARNHAVAADRAKTVVLNNMTRDINVPLNSIVGFSQLMADEKGGNTQQERAEYFRQIRANTDQLLGIVGEALEKAQQ